MGGADSNVGPGRMAYPTPNNLPQQQHIQQQLDHPPPTGTTLNATSPHHPVEAPVGEMTDLNGNDNDDNQSKMK